MMHFGKLIIFVSILHSISAEVQFIKLHQDPSFSCTILSKETLRKFKGFHTEDENALYVKVRPAVHSPGDFNIDLEDASKIIEIYARKEAVISAHTNTLCKTMKDIPSLIPKAGTFAPEVVKIIDGGDQANRIDVVFMGDGFQLSERQEFFDDISRLTNEMFEGVTFKSYLPLFNIWAIFVESVDSGIGYDGPKDTPFQLYREAGQLRGIYPGNSAYARQICRLTGTGGCDYPSLIGNDDFYGGLGGEFVISTKSNRTGTVVLRHEMGHNFADVGEEYDGGSVYSGVNAASSVTNLGWKNWLSGGGPAREQRAIYRLLEYPWHDLSDGPITLTFTSDGQYSIWYMVISVTAAGEEDSLEFILDGEVLPWTSSRSDDREFYDWYGQAGFTAGSHNLTLRSKTTPSNSEIPRMIASVDLHEFGNATEFVQDNSFISAYPTWNYVGRKSFRPTNAGCLMRNMTHNSFCPVCQEGIWFQFLERISLIDSLEIAPIENINDPRNVTLSTLKLGQLRSPGNEIEGERLEVKWTRNGTEEVSFRDQFKIAAVSGTWTVQVELISPEIRSDPQGLLVETEAFVV